LEGEVEAGKRLDGGELGHLKRHFDAPVFPQRELFGEQDVESVQRGGFATLDTTQRDVEDFKRTRHLQADEVALDAINDGRGAHRGAPAKAASRRPTAS